MGKAGSLRLDCSQAGGFKDRERVFEERTEVWGSERGWGLFPGWRLSRGKGTRGKNENASGGGKGQGADEPDKKKRRTVVDQRRWGRPQEGGSPKRREKKDLQLGQRAVQGKKGGHRSTRGAAPRKKTCSRGISEEKERRPGQQERRKTASFREKKK